MEALKTNVSDPYLSVIVITAQPGHKPRALQAGAEDFISKPFDLVEVRVQERTAELEESEARFRSLTELAWDWYWSQDEDGNFIYLMAWDPLQLRSVWEQRIAATHASG